MATGSASNPNHHSVNIHPVIDDGNEANINNISNNKPVKLSKFRRDFATQTELDDKMLPNVPAVKSLGRQVSLESGFAALNMEKNRRKGNNKEDGKVLRRSVKSLGLREGMAASAEAGMVKGGFNLFRTKSTLTKQMSLLPSREFNINSNNIKDDENDDDHIDVPAGRYFAALRGPELDEVRDSEDILLPKDELWPFLLRFPIGCFGISLGLGSQAILWAALAKSSAMKFLHISPMINLSLWLLTLAILIAITITYCLKCIFYFEAIRREYFHPIRVNFFFAPWIAGMFLAIGTPALIGPNKLHPAIWCVFVAPLLVLELKIYGQWLSGGKRRLCKVANPSSHLSVVGNFVGAILAAKVGWVEAGKFLWAVGLAHYLCLFVTLYQRLPTSEALPKELHPVYSMFIATPSAASIAWATIYGRFDAIARSFYFIALFLYCSLVVRINFFRGFKFSLAWWSYTFPMTTASIATVKYAEEAPGFFSKGMALSLSLMSSTIVAVLLVSTILHALVWRSLFPNDHAIAITKNKINGGKPPKDKNKHTSKKSYHDHIKRWAKESITFTGFIYNKSGNHADNDSSGHGN